MRIYVKRVAELSRDVRHCGDFTEQVSVDTEKGSKTGYDSSSPYGEIVVDSKVPLLRHILKCHIYRNTEEKKKMERHRQTTRKGAHEQAFASKKNTGASLISPRVRCPVYSRRVLLSPALEMDSTLIEDGIQKEVIVPPTTFIALLRAIAYGWRQEQLTDNAKQVGVLDKELYDRIEVQ